MEQQQFNEILALLGRPQPGGIHPYGVVDSTMTIGQTLAREGAPQGAVVLAEGQTAGVGRLGRSFASPPGQGIYLSLILRPRPGASVSWLTPLAGLAVCRAVEEEAGLSPELKWPNDVILQGRKLCGILTQTALGDGDIRHAVVGVGLNLTQELFPPELADKAISLRMAGAGVTRPRMTAALIRHLTDLLVERAAYEAMPGELMDELRRRSCTLGREIKLVDRQGETLGFAVDLDQEGGLIVDTPQGRRVVSSGEVSVRGLLGYLPQEIEGGSP